MSFDRLRARETTKRRGSRRKREAARTDHILLFVCNQREAYRCVLQQRNFDDFNHPQSWLPHRSSRRIWQAMPLSGSIRRNLNRRSSCKLNLTSYSIFYPMLGNWMICSLPIHGVRPITSSRSKKTLLTGTRIHRWTNWLHWADRSSKSISPRQRFCDATSICMFRPRNQETIKASVYKYKSWKKSKRWKRLLKATKRWLPTTTRSITNCWKTSTNIRRLKTIICIWWNTSERFSTICDRSSWNCERSSWKPTTWWWRI